VTPENQSDKPTPIPVECLAVQHWSYVEGISRMHYISAFIHGHKHGYEAGYKAAQEERGIPVPHGVVRPGGFPLE